MHFVHMKTISELIVSIFIKVHMYLEIYLILNNFYLFIRIENMFYMTWIRSIS